MELLFGLLTIGMVHMLGLVSPGPDFALTVKNSLVHGRKAGVYSALGIAAGIAVHVSYSLLGIGFIISQSILLFSIVKYAGAAYLVYIGFKALKAKKASEIEIEKTETHMSPRGALKQGFVTNVLNPKATLFIFGVFTQVIDPQTSLAVQAAYGAEMIALTALWFSLVASVLSFSTVRSKFQKVQHIVERTMGAVLIGLGIKVAVSK